MTPLAPRLFDRRYADLVEQGRAQLPALAPEWTDHNAHDPGITFIELLAWTTEAQLYSLGRMRRDERLSYAALLGVRPQGTRPARGILLRDRDDPASPATTFAAARVIRTDASVLLEGQVAPVFQPVYPTLWSPGRIVSLRAHLAGGEVRDLTANNDRGRPFLPFGESAGPRDVLHLEFETRGDDGLFPAQRRTAEGAAWVLGVRAANETAATAAPDPRATPPGDLQVTLLAGSTQYPLPVLEDSTAGLLRTGALVLDPSAVTGSPRNFRLEIRARRGSARPPRLLRIEPNALPIVQRVPIENERHDASGEPAPGVELEEAGLCFGPAEEPLRVEVRGSSGVAEWTRCERLSEQGPLDRVYELDAVRGRLRFGNGLNGARPERGAEIYASYAVSEGADGNVAAHRRWTVTGFSGVFGVNPDRVTGGAPASDLLGMRRDAREQARDLHVLVSAGDIESAALLLSLYDVARARVVEPRGRDGDTGTVRLVVLRARYDGVEPQHPPETARWLEAVRRGLAGRMPLGSRLVVEAPRYADFSVDVELEVEAGRDPAAIEEGVRNRLRDELAPVATTSSPQPRDFGLPVGISEMRAWVRSVGGVARITRFDVVRRGAVHAEEEIAVRRGGLPRLLGVSIRASRAAPGARP